jgi:hypothetical protein
MNIVLNRFATVPSDYEKKRKELLISNSRIKF